MPIGSHHLWMFLIPTASALVVACAPAAMELRSEDQRVVVQAPEEQPIPLARRDQLLSLRNRDEARPPKEAVCDSARCGQRQAA